MPCFAKRTANATSAFCPMVTFVESTTRTRPPHACAAASALSCVPDSFADSVMTTASSEPPASGAPSTPSIVCENANGDTWLVRGSSSDSTSFS